MKLFYKDFQPYSVVEDEGLREVFHALNPNYVLPTRKTFSKTLIPAAYEEAKHNLMQIYSSEEIVAVTLTTDCWTSINVENFMAVTSHYINSKFELKTHVLGCFPFSQSHTSRNLADELNRVALEWGIKDKILICVSDNAANITKAIKEVLKWKHIGCLAHTINLIVKLSLNGSHITSLLKKIRVIIGHFKHSSSSTQKLKEVQIQNGLEPKKLIQDIVTRWNSTYDMLERFIELQTAVRTTIALMGKSIESLSPEEWSAAAEIKNILLPMKQLTNMMSGDQYTTASSAIVFVDGLLNTYTAMVESKKYVETNSQVLMRNIIEGINTLLGSLEKSNDSRRFRRMSISILPFIVSGESCKT